MRKKFIETTILLSAYIQTTLAGIPYAFSIIWGAIGRYEIDTRIQLIKRYLSGYFIGILLKRYMSNSPVGTREIANWFMFLLLIDIEIDKSTSYTDLENIDDYLSTIVSGRYPRQSSIDNKPIENLNWFYQGSIALRSEPTGVFNFKIPNQIEAAIEGQRRSIYQVLKPVRSFRWYIDEVVPLKTFPSILAPLQVMVVDACSQRKFCDFQHWLKKLDMKYGVWQIQDDIIDMRDDISNGIWSAPSYLALECSADEDCKTLITALEARDYFMAFSIVKRARSVHALACPKAAFNAWIIHDPAIDAPLKVLLLQIEKKMRRAAERAKLILEECAQ